MNEILEKPLYKLLPGEVNFIRQLGDTLFSRLVQPFKQTRAEREFDFQATMRAAMRTGHLLPTYVRHEKTHPKSKVVIAMSLSGIDRCFAVGLIPLLSQLRKYLDFRLYVYTDDLVEAEFSDDGFITNDCDIAWNNVLAPCVFSRLLNLNFDKQETKLLLIDSLGGLDSQWYTSVEPATLAECAEEQKPFVGPNEWSRVRQWLSGRYEDFGNVPPHLLPREWKEKLVSNIQKRWVETPALREHLIRYIFNPRFGEKKHGDFPAQRHMSIRSLVEPLKEKFKSVHILTPSFSDESENTLEQLKNYSFVDFHHKADTLEGFAQTLIDIVYGRETDRITRPLVRFEDYVEDKEAPPESTHSELTKTFRDCFVNCQPVENWLPSRTHHEFSRRKRGANYLEDYTIPFRDVDVSNFFYRLDDIFGDWRIDPFWTKYGKVRKAKSVLKIIRENRIAFSERDLYCQDKEANDWESLKSKVEYERHRTMILKQHVEYSFDLYDKYAYGWWFDKLPLQNAVWCTVGKFRPDVLSISARPASTPDDQRATTLHEKAHWAEHVCPLIGVFTNALLEYLVGSFDKVVPVGVGEVAAEVKRAGRKPWIIPYAGKWYRRYEPNLPNPSEVFSVHAEYFRSPEALATLMEHDPWIVKAIAFIFMGGPVALVNFYGEKKRGDALKDIEQRDRASFVYEEERRKKREEKEREKQERKERKEREKQERKSESPAPPPTETRRRFGI